MASVLKNLKQLVFNKGGFGKSISREETVERLNPIVRRHIELNHAYNYAAAHLSDEIAGELERHQKTARADVGKLNETIFSMGGTAYSGVDLEPEDFNLGDKDDDMLFVLQDQEQELQEKVNDELNMDLPEHHIRTKAILMNVRAHSEERLNLLKQHTRKRQRAET